MDELNGILQKTKDKSTQKEQDEVAIQPNHKPITS